MSRHSPTRTSAPRRAGRVRGLLHEAGLADPGLAPHDDEPWGARRTRLDLADQDGDIAVATDQLRARDAAGHGNDGTAPLKAPRVRATARRSPVGRGRRPSRDGALGRYGVACAGAAPSTRQRITSGSGCRSSQPEPLGGRAAGLGGGLAAALGGHGRRGGPAAVVEEDRRVTGGGARSSRPRSWRTGAVTAAGTAWGFAIASWPKATRPTIAAATTIPPNAAPSGRMDGVDWVVLRAADIGSSLDPGPAPIRSEPCDRRRLMSASSAWAGALKSGSNPTRHPRVPQRPGAAGHAALSASLAFPSGRSSSGSSTCKGSARPCDGTLPATRRPPGPRP